jgi:protein tyrosine/serine phosphatase
MKPSAILLILLLGCGKSQAGVASTGQTFAQKIKAPGLDNFAKIHNGLYRGARPSAKGLEHLKSLGVRTIVNLRSNHSQKKEAEALGFRVIEIPLQADILGSTPPSDGQLKTFFETILDPARQPVYFHCAHGKDRTGTMAALYRIEVEGWTPNEAIQEMQAFGYHDIYTDLIAFVRAYRPRGYNPPR